MMQGGARDFPAGQAFMQPAPKRHHLVGPLICSSAAALHSQPQATCDLVLAQEDEGLAAWCLRLGPDMRTHAPDPARGGGQDLLVAGGTRRHDGAMLSRLSCLYISADAGPSCCRAVRRAWKPCCSSFRWPKPLQSSLGQCLGRADLPTAAAGQVTR
jgi:hypothetical protein